MRENVRAIRLVGMGSERSLPAAVQHTGKGNQQTNGSGDVARDGAQELTGNEPC